MTPTWMIGRWSRISIVAASLALAACGSTTTPPTATATVPGSTTTPSSAPTSASATPTGGCTYLDAATVQQDVGITIATATQIALGCFLESASGSHDAPNAVRYLHGHDGLIVGIASGTLQLSHTCQQTSIPGVPAPAGVCQQAAGVTVASFQLSGGRVGTLIIYAPGTPSLNGVDQLAAAAYPKMLAG